MRIRPATASDIAAIAEVGAKTWPLTYAFAGTDYIAHGLATWWSPHAIARSLTTTDVLVAETEPSTVIGTGNIDLRGETAIIWKLYVLPPAQGTGAGHALITALTDRAPGRTVQLEYTDGNHRAARFYAAHGFTELRREPSGTPGWPDTVWLTKEQP
ncbi:GNAT family N-acetyltransferase [Paractinoplanes atraurantiacus]|uniref:L-amino acid N-acyltransferase YncA n=1 Tax=Paractinoplanes atraurantiacus TaxID=1036182 RepID=A0A285IDB1_9ACTN|nr:GNAT family N-acetyltransferase [Actinoplanes atraurantiacus]SNY45066.1 L-amino acid N-acyltransferase YncA [Actinoplanes atraurantiacus]